MPQSEKQKAASRASLARMRAENPDKFNPNKNGAKEKWLARAAARRLEKERAEQALQNAGTPTPATSTPPATVAAPVTAPAPAPAQVTTSTAPAKPDTALFSETVPPPRMTAEAPAPGAGIPPGSPPPGENFDPPPNGSAPPPPGESAAPTSPTQDTRKLAITVWAMIVNLLVAIFGDAMQPRRIEVSPGQFYDENEMMIGAWADYLASLGIKPLTPLMNLWLAFAAYCLPRMTVIVLKFKSWFKKKEPAGSRGAPAPEARQEPAQSPSPETPAPKEQPAKESAKPQPQTEVPDNELGDS